ncbi:hypothetical protein ACHHYP_10279 [Achlya hypogyna]|uniref:Secreted protein n=1 Tax=Achlya hypogyna TaxID=1202772 RepID=A0A1V9YLW0_ACHHY|nr:hypothetical protein ACHHYP_10279 [Achlya hypogyna]
MEWIYLLVLLPLLDWVPACCVGRLPLVVVPADKESAAAAIARVAKLRERTEAVAAYHMIPLVLGLFVLQLCSIYDVVLHPYVFYGLLGAMACFVVQCVRYAIALRALQDEQEQWEAWLEREFSPYYTH